MNQNNGITRRAVITGIVASAAVPLLARQGLASTKVAAARRGRGLGKSGKTALPRYLHSAVTLQDGRVLVTGGYHVNEEARSRGLVPPSTSVQIFDPASHSWLNAAPMALPRARHASVLLPDGRVAVLGGFYNTALDSVEIYEPRTNTWTKGKSLPQPMCDLTACLAQGRVVIGGGAFGASAHVLDAISE